MSGSIPESAGTTRRRWSPNGGTGIAVAHAGRACGKAASEDFFDMACPGGADLRERGIVLALADGVSGSAGRRAAETCVRSVLSDYYATPPDWDVSRCLDRVIGAVNGWLAAHNLRAAESDCMLSTLSVLVLQPGRFHVAHVGDCRIYRLRGGHCERLTTDHVWPRADMRHVLRRALGLDQHLVLDCFADATEPGDCFLMLSDGVWEVLGDGELNAAVTAASDPLALARALVERAADIQRGYYGRNDATAVVVRVDAA